MENLILIDWLSFTSRIDSVESILNLLGLVDIKFVDMYGMQGFQNRLNYEGISIHYNSTCFEGVWVEMSGQGCRAFETFSSLDWFEIFSFIVDEPDNYNITRLDVAYDDHTGILPINSIAHDVKKCNFVSKFQPRSITCTYSAGNVGYTIDCGSRKSAIKFRIYDKAFERHREDEGHWVRFEVQMRDERALSFLKLLTFDNLGELFLGVITNYIRFVRPTKNDTNKRRWELRKYWSDFIGAVEPIRLWTKCTLDYNLAKCEDYVYIQCGNALDTLIKIKGVEGVIKGLKENKPKTNQKYVELINSNKCVEVDPVLRYLEERGVL